MVDRIKQFRIIDGRSGADLTERLNAALRELHDKSPRVEFEGLVARIEYTEENEIPGLETDNGRKKKTLALKCGDCPYFEPLRRADGEIDRRAKRGYCPFSKYMGFASRESLVCETFLNLMENGELRIVKAEMATPATKGANGDA